MYSIFNTKSRKHNHLLEGEPPPKKITTEGDVLIKTLSENQLKTNTSLSEQFSKKKDFVSSEKYTDITSHIIGETNLDDFKAVTSNVDEYNIFKSKNLSDRDIVMFKEYSTMGDQFWQKYKRINKDVLTDYIRNIEHLLKGSKFDLEKNNADSLSRHQQEYLNSLKPESIETKLLTFASRNEQSKNTLLGPMDELANLEKEFSNTIEEYSSCDIKKIQKKARSMGNKIKNLDEAINNISNLNRQEKSINRNELNENSLWDVHEKPKNNNGNIEVVNKSKMFTCKPQNWYTIRDGEIVKLDNSKSSSNLTVPSSTEKVKLSISEIRNIPKFSNYEVGDISKVLFLKNLPKNIDESIFKHMLTDIQGNYSIKIMKGKMSGQAFIEFKEELHSVQALDIINGILIKGKPVIVQFGKKK